MPRARLARCLLAASLVTAALEPEGSAQPAPAKSAEPAPARSAEPAPPAGMVQDFEGLARWIERQRRPRCAERCFVLDHLRLSGQLAQGQRDNALSFELEGSVLAEGPVAVPLFGPPQKVRLEHVTEDGKPAQIGFEGGHYFVHTASRRFTLKGTLHLEGELSLSIPGPLNSLEAELTGGRLVEGSRLSGLEGATVHLAAGADEQGATEPTVFQLSRALRVSREVAFEYRLLLRSGADLGVVRLPLSLGERVLEVSGSRGWKQEGSELVLPTAGRAAEITLTGTLASLGKLGTDARSPYEWWLLESDAEHRVQVSAEAKQIDASQSPIAPTQPGARLFLLQRGQQVTASVQSLASVEALAATVRLHERTLVLTRGGDVVADDRLSYENNGVDYLAYSAGGRPIFLATDNVAERIVRRADDAAEMLIPLRTGSHTVRVQALSSAALSPLMDRLSLPVPTYPVTASRQSLTVGLPAHMHPVALLGGDTAQWFFDVGDLVAMAIGLLAGMLSMPGRPSKAAGGLFLAGLWLVSAPAFVAVLGAMAIAFLSWLTVRLLKGTSFYQLAQLGLLALGGLLAVVVFSMTLSRAGKVPSMGGEYGASGVRQGPMAGGTALPNDASLEAKRREKPALATTLLPGVSPVALNLPDHAHSLTTSRELVTRERPLSPSLIYVTNLGLLPLLLGWLSCGAFLAWSHRRTLEQLAGRVSERLKKEPPPPPQGAPGETR